VLLDSLTRHHALVDGNRRLGWVATVVFYGLNGIRVEAPDDAAYDLVIAVSTGHLGYRESATRLAAWADDNRGAGEPGRITAKRNAD
jgi:death-on-curing protein